MLTAGGPFSYLTTIPAWFGVCCGGRRGAWAGIRIGILGDDGKSVERCDPIRGAVTDAVVTWDKGLVRDLGKYVNGAVTLVFEIPDDATAFAFEV